MVAYPEPWMDRVDAMKSPQGWTDTSCCTSANSGVFGEQILLGVALRRLDDGHRAGTGGQLGALLAPGDPGLHPRLPRRHRHRPHRAQRIRRCRRRCCAASWRNCNGSRGRRRARLYLGALPWPRPCHRSLRPFGTLTTGVPAALREPPKRRRSRPPRRLDRSRACDLARSTLHAFWDLFTVLAANPRASWTMPALPIARWGPTDREAAGRGFATFRHHDPAALDKRLGCARRAPDAPWIVVDGFCTGCGRLAPLADYLALARKTGARLVVDDTQALGILGDREVPRRPTVAAAEARCARPQAPAQTCSWSRPWPRDLVPRSP